MKHKKTFIPFFLSTLLIFLTQAVMAHCPLCIAGTGAAVAVTRAYGVDDFVVGLFFGGLTVSSAFWLDKILKKRNKGDEHVPFQQPLIIILFSIFTVVSFYFAGMLGNIYPVYLIFGLDKILVGTLVGSFVTLAASRFNDSFLRSINNRKNFVPFQVIIVTIVFLAATSFAFYFSGLI